MNPQQERTRHNAVGKAAAVQAAPEMDEWQPIEPRALTVEERAQLQSRFPLYVAIDDLHAALKPVQKLRNKSARRVAMEERARRIAEAKARVEYDLAVLEDRNEIDALQEAGPRGEPLSREFWRSAQDDYEKAQAQLNALERMPRGPTHKELCWARAHLQIAASILDAHQLPDGSERKRALGTAGKSDLNLYTWSREKLAHELITIMTRLVQRQDLTAEQFAREALRICEPLNMAWLATSREARPLLGRDWCTREAEVKAEHARWARETMSKDIEQLAKAVLRALGASQGDVQEIFRVDYHREVARDRRENMREAKQRMSPVAV